MRDRQALSVHGRPFAVGLPSSVLEGVQAGTLRTSYKGRRLAKNPFDLVLYVRLLEALRPRAIVEIGTLDGGSAVWLADQCRALALDCVVHTLDCEPPAEPIAHVQVHAGDASNPEETFPHAVLAQLPHPWLVIEDSAHTFETTRAVLRYMHSRLQAGDVVVVEDGVVADLPGAEYRVYDDGPNRAVQEFLQAHPTAYRIDTEQCDFFGPNVTYAPNAWLHRVE